MASNVELIKEKLGIVEVVGSYLKLNKAGKNFKAKCPFHNEKTPSFFISPERDSFYCFGCGKGGDIFTFVEEFEGLDFLGAMKVLADRSGVDIKLKKGYKEDKEKKDKTLELLEESTKFFEKNLKENKEVLLYFKDRGIKNQTLKDFRVGFAKAGWRNLHEHLKEKGFEEKEMKEAGVIGESKGKVYDLFRERIIFPISDVAGRVVAFSGRVYGKNDSNAKYINSPETKLFKKSKILYGFDKAKIHIRKNDFAILVEGMTDVLMAHQIGYKNTSAVSGTSLTEEHLNLLKRLTKRLVFAFDADSAGFRASSRAAKMALSMGLDLKVAKLPKEKDPADVIKENPEMWKKSIKEASHIVDYLFSVLKEKAKNERDFSIKVKEEILPYIVMIESKIDQSHFVKKISEELGVKEEVLFEEMKKIDIGEKETLTPEISDNSFSRKDEIEKRIVGIALWQKNKDQKVIKDFLKEVKEKEGNDLMKKYDKKEMANFVTMAEVLFEGSENLEKEIKELILNYKEDQLKESLLKKMMEIKKTESKKDDKKIKILLKDYQKISRELENLKKERI